MMLIHLFMSCQVNQYNVLYLYEATLYVLTLHECYPLKHHL